MLILLGLYVLSALFIYIQGWIMSGISAKITYKFREEISRKINRLPLKYFDRTSQGDVLSRVTNDVDTISRTLNQSLSQIITSITTVIGVTIMMFSISWQLTLVAMLILPVSMGLIAFIVKMSQRYFKKQQEYLGKVNGHIEEMYGGHIVVKAFNGEAKSIETFDKLNGELYDSACKSVSLRHDDAHNDLRRQPGIRPHNHKGGWFAVRKMITVGDIQAFIQYVRSFTQPIAQIANIMNIFQQTAAAARESSNFWKRKREITETTTPVTGVDHHGHVEFKNVRFGYDPEKIIIKGFSCDVDKGHNIAIVGPTGAGKTTIVKLLMRFYDVNSGEILLDGHNINDYTRHDLRENFGMVLQDTWLYNASIRDNIRYGRLNATDEEVLAAAKAAHVDSFIHTLPDGYNLVLNEEQTNISQGQKQLITIARAILATRRSSLDEATSSVDTRTKPSSSEL